MAILMTVFGLVLFFAFENHQPSKKEDLNSRLKTWSYWGGPVSMAIFIPLLGLYNHERLKFSLIQDKFWLSLFFGLLAGVGLHLVLLATKGRGIQSVKEFPSPIWPTITSFILSLWALKAFLNE